MVGGVTFDSNYRYDLGKGTSKSSSQTLWKKAELRYWNLLAKVNSKCLDFLKC